MLKGELVSSKDLALWNTDNLQQLHFQIADILSFIFEIVSICLLIFVVSLDLGDPK